MIRFQKFDQVLAAKYLHSNLWCHSCECMRFANVSSLNANVRAQNEKIKRE